MVGNVIVQCELLLISIFQFLCPQENIKFIHGGQFEFQLNRAYKKIYSWPLAAILKFGSITCTSPCC